MSRAGVPTDHAERAIGHVIAGVRSVYDRHEYLAEKKKAFEALASLIEQILNPAPNIEQIAKHRRAGGSKWQAGCRPALFVRNQSCRTAVLRLIYSQRKSRTSRLYVQRTAISPRQ